MTVAPNFKSSRVSRPSRNITLSGEELDAVALAAIIKMTVRSEMNGLDRFELVVRNTRDAKKKEYLYSDKDMYLPGNTIKIELGYMDAGAMATVFEGIITSIETKFPYDKPSLLYVSGICKCRSLVKTQTSKVFSDKSDLDIIKSIASEAGISVTIEAGSQGQTVNDYRLQVANYDMIFIMEKIHALGLDFHLGNGGTSLYVGKAGSYTGPQKNLSFGETLIAFQGAVDTSHQVGKVQVLGWDSMTKEAIDVSASRSEITEGSAWASDVTSAFKDRTEVISDFPVSDQSSAKELAIAAMQRIANTMVTGHGLVTGTADLAPGQSITLDGLDRRFSGTYRVISVEHEFGEEGLVTKFDARMEKAS